MYRPIIGNETVYDVSNGNTTRLVEFAKENCLIVNSSFSRKNINKYMWTTPNEIYQSQINYVLVDKVYKSCIVT